MENSPKSAQDRTTEGWKLWNTKTETLKWKSERDSREDENPRSAAVRECGLRATGVRRAGQCCYAD
jgi:hypothetical protein